MLFHAVNGLLYKKLVWRVVLLFKGQLRQNYGYDGYSDDIPMWTNWEDAVADEEKTN